MPTSTNLAHELERLADLWSPRVLARVNDQYVKVARVKGELAWHQHDDEDELFLVVRGRLLIQMHAGNVSIGPGEFYVVPRGTPPSWIVMPPASGENVSSAPFGRNATAVGEPSMFGGFAPAGALT